MIELIRMAKNIVLFHRLLWRTLLWERWETLKLEEKIIWLLVVNHTIAILTLLELLVLKK
jgi:hypothetical protein